MPGKPDKIKEDEYLDARLAQPNLTPQDIDIVVMSHLHFDHIHELRIAPAGSYS